MDKSEFMDCLAYCRTAFVTVDRAFESAKDRHALTEIWLSVWQDLNAEHVLAAIREIVADLDLQPRSASQFPGRIAHLAKRAERDAVSAQAQREYASNETTGCERCRGKRWLYMRPHNHRSQVFAAEVTWPETGFARIACECNEDEARRYDPDKHGPCYRRAELWKIDRYDSQRDQEIIAAEDERRKQWPGPKTTLAHKDTAPQISAGEIAQAKADLKREVRARWKSGTKLAEPK